MTVRVRERAAMGALASMTLATCGLFGDKGLPIEFVNRTGESVTPYEKLAP
jgi:hypothetical protein